MYRAKDFLCGVRERSLDVGERPESYKVKPVTGVAEVGRIRVTDQRAPREPASGNPPRRRRRGPRLIESAYREQNSVYPTILPACPPACLLLSLPSFASLRLSLPRRRSSRILFPFLKRISILLAPMISFAYHACAVSILFRCSRCAFYYISFRPLFYSFFSLSLCFLLIPPFVIRSFSDSSLDAPALTCLTT